MSDQLKNVIQSLLAAIGGFLVMKGVNSGLVETGSGVVLGLISVIWAIVGKTATTNSIVLALQQALTFVGGILIADGKWSATQLNTWVGIVTTVVPAILGYFHIGIATTTSTTIASSASK